jgi:hypothetical protein
LRLRRAKCPRQALILLRKLGVCVSNGGLNDSSSLAPKLFVPTDSPVSRRLMLEFLKFPCQLLAGVVLVKTGFNAVPNVDRAGR